MSGWTPFGAIPAGRPGINPLDLKTNRTRKAARKVGKRLGKEVDRGLRKLVSASQNEGRFDEPTRTPSSVGGMPGGAGPQQWATRPRPAFAQPPAALKGRQLQYYVVREPRVRRGPAAVGGTSRPKALTAGPDNPVQVLHPTAIFSPSGATVMAARDARNRSFQRWAGA